MKKFLIVFMATVLAASNANAWWGHWGSGHHRPRPPVTERHHRPVHVVHNYHHDRLDGFFAGLVGSAIGSYMVTGTYPQPLYNTVPVKDTQCFLLVSQKTNKAVKRCVEVTDSLNQDDVYKVLFLD